MKKLCCTNSCPVAKMSLNALMGALSGLFSGLVLALVIYGIAYLIAMIAGAEYFHSPQGLVTIAMAGMSFGTLIGAILGGRVGLKTTPSK
ncbi:hypothetical protein KKD70_03415 [Patescibacteria group bacterium]|nr:hypothetical protein [Patescibacteria group bacterium]